MLLYQLQQHNCSVGTMPKDQIIRCIVFTNKDREANSKAGDKAVALLGPGGNKVSTRLWWDVKK